MKKNLKLRLITIVLTLCMCISLVPVSMMTTYASGVGADSFSDWRAWEFYSRAASTAGKILESLGEATDSKSVEMVTSFINNNFCGGDTTDEQLAELQNTCNEILEVTKGIDSIVSEISQKMDKKTVTNLKKECDKAWKEQVTDYITKFDESTYNFSEAYTKYREYLAYASGLWIMPKGETIEDYEDAYIDELVKYYITATGEKNVDETTLYKSDYIDTVITGTIKAMLAELDPYSGVSVMGSRFIDLAAQYAYYAFPTSSEQAEFIDYAVQYQINYVTYMVMMYQDYVAHRAEYMVKNPDVNADEWWDTYYETYYEDLIEYYNDSISNFLNGEIYLVESDAYTTLEKYVRGDSTTAYYDEESESFTLENENFKSTRNLKNNSNKGTYAKTTEQYMSFNKDASVKVENGELVFTPYYVLVGNDNCLLKNFDINDENSHGPGLHLYDRHYLNCDYYNLTTGVFTDGVNNYVPVSDPEQLKDLVNETYYSVNDCKTPYSYFSSIIGYGSKKPVYLLLSGDTYMDDKTCGTEYTHFPVFNMQSELGYNDTWKSEDMSLYNLQSDRKDSENKTNSLYTLILVPQDDEIRSKVDTKIIGTGSVEVSDYTTLDKTGREKTYDTYNESDGTAVSGKKVDVDITLPENYVVSSVWVEYHNDISNPEKVTDTKVICEGTETNLCSFDYSVPYSNVTIVVETMEISE